MIKLLKIIGKKKREKLVSTLDEFIRQTKLNIVGALLEDLNPNESRKNLEESLIELIYYDGQHSSSGLLFTNNGYFLTAKHCIENPKELMARLYNGKSYKIKKVYAVSHKSDIGLAKIKISGNYGIKKFRVYNTNKLEKIPIVLLIRKDGQIKEKYGMVDRDWSPNTNKLNHFSSSVPTKPGDSGGIIINPDGKLIGIHSEGGDNKGSHIKIIRALELIEFYKNQNL